MATWKVTFLPHEISIDVDDGQSIIRAAMDAGVHINASCGGEGVCGKCRVIIEQGQVEGGISEQLSQQDREAGYRLACQALVRGDTTVRVPVESAIDRSVLNLSKKPRRTARIKQVDFESIKEQGLFIPPVEKIHINMDPPDASNHQPDVTRMIQELRQHHGEHGLEVSLEVIRKVPRVFRQKDFDVTVTMARPVRAGGKTRIVNIQSGDTTAHNLAIAVDIGTTTIYGQMVDLISGKVLAEYGDFNGQISYGEDVITRIVFAEKGDGLEILNQAVIKTINNVLEKIIRRSKIDTDNISVLTIAGNTTMTQLLLKVDPRHIRRSPYVPTAGIYPAMRASDLGLSLGEHVTALVYPQVSSYVGGDIVAGVMGSGMYRTDKLTLFLDIGTNAEAVVGNREWMACAACSAGPAFEGGGIKFGMRAARGAIEDFSVDPVTYEPMIVTIGDVRPKGICGSGLITTVATMFELGMIDNQGKFNRELETERIRNKNGIWEYVLAWKDQTQIGRDIALTEIDIENLIRAKGAIYSGCMTLLEEVGMNIDDLEQIILAGGFGSYVDLEKAMVIGLLPEIEPNRVTYVGNASLMGARMAALTNRIRQEVVAVTDMMTNFELSETPSYMDHYVAALFLPHTDMNRFPRVSERLQQRRQAMEK